MNVLLTTPDYPPKIGGLSTFSENIYNVLCSLDLKVDLLVWNSLGDLQHKSQNLTDHYKFIINIQSLASTVLKFDAKQINFYHGSENLFYSKNIFKYLLKRIFKNKIIKYYEKCHTNVFISNFTFNKLKQYGFVPALDRDLVLHNNIHIINKNYFAKKLDNDLVFICVARDVPHKNMQAAIKFSITISKKYQKKIKLYITSDRFSSIDNVEIIPIKNCSNLELQDYYKNSHLHLLFSEDHSSRGHFEGFGLSVLEAAQYGVPSIVYNSGGLNESVHDGMTGWVLQSLDQSYFTSVFKLIQKEYPIVSKNCFVHTQSSHSLDIYRDHFLRILNL